MGPPVRWKRCGAWVLPVMSVYPAHHAALRPWRKSRRNGAQRPPSVFLLDQNVIAPPTHTCTPGLRDQGQVLFSFTVPFLTFSV